METAECISLVGAFLIGSIPFGFLAGKCNGVDLRQKGSGNIGATNVSRTLGKKWAAIVFLLDFLKGFVPVFLIYLFMDAPPQWLPLVAGFLAILGHNFTPWLKFKGGRGIATSAGVLLGVAPAVLAVGLSLWIILTLTTRYVSVGSIAASLSLPLASLYFYPGQWWKLLFCVAAGFLGIWRHRPNIARLLSGTETKIGGNKAAA